MEDLVETSYDDLIKIDGVGEKTANKIMEIVSELVDFDESEEAGGENREGEVEQDAGSTDEGIAESGASEETPSE